MAKQIVATWQRSKPYLHNLGYVERVEVPEGVSFWVYCCTPDGPFVMRDADGEAVRFSCLSDALVAGAAHNCVRPTDTLTIEQTASPAQAA